MKVTAGHWESQGERGAAWIEGPGLTGFFQLWAGTLRAAPRAASCGLEAAPPRLVRLRPGPIAAAPVSPASRALQFPQVGKFTLVLTLGRGHRQLRLLPGSGKSAWPAFACGHAPGHAP